MKKTGLLKIASFLFVFLFFYSYCQAQNYYVTNMNDTGPGSLYDAISNSNADTSPQPDSIIFQLTGAGPYEFFLKSNPPVFGNYNDSLIIDAQTQAKSATGTGDQSIIINAKLYNDPWYVIYVRRAVIANFQFKNFNSAFTISEGTIATCSFDSCNIVSKIDYSGNPNAWINIENNYYSNCNLPIYNYSNGNYGIQLRISKNAFYIIPQNAVYLNDKVGTVIIDSNYYGIDKLGNHGFVSHTANRITNAKKAICSNNVVFNSYDSQDGDNFYGIDSLLIINNIFGKDKAGNPGGINGSPIRIQTCKYSLVKGNYISRGREGVFMLDSDFIRFEENTIAFNVFEGLIDYYYPVDSVEIINNKIFSNGSDGIHFEHIAGSVIKGNEIYSNGTNHGTNQYANGGNGIFLRTYNQNSIIENNLIGIDSLGNSKGNYRNGIRLEGGSQAIIKNNVVGSSGSAGIFSSSYMTVNILSNLIGIDKNGNPHPNTYGMELDGGMATVGDGTVAGQNVIRENFGYGIYSYGYNNEFNRNIIFNNTNYPVYLGDKTFGNWGNNSKRTPTLLRQDYVNGNVELTFISDAKDKRIDIYTKDDGFNPDTYVTSSASAHLGSGIWKATFAWPDQTEKFIIQATDSFGNSSEFGFQFASCGLVTNTNDNGPGSLRDAIVCAKTLPGVNQINFAIPSNGPYIIYVKSDFPVIDSVIIDGSTQALSGVGTGDQTIIVDGIQNWMQKKFIVKESSIKKITIKNIKYAFYLKNSTVQDCKIDNCKVPFDLRQANNETSTVRIINNEISNGDTVLTTYDQYANEKLKVVFEGNYVYNFPTGIAFASWFADSKMDEITVRNNKFGIDKQGAVYDMTQVFHSWSAGKVNFTGNEIYKCDYTALYLRAVDSAFVDSNYFGITKNNIQGSLGDEGVRFDDVKFYRVNNNKLGKANIRGFHIWNHNLPYCSGSVERNVIYSTPLGLYLENNGGMHEVKSVSDNQITSCTYAGAYFLNLKMKLVKGNTIGSASSSQGNSMGFEINYVTIDSLTKNKFLNNNEGIKITSTPVGNFVITENLFSGNKTNAITLWLWADSIIVKGNIFEQNENAIYFNNTSRGNLIENNLFRWNNNGVIIQNTSSGNLLLNNSFIGNKTKACEVFNVSDKNKISSNKFQRNGSSIDIHQGLADAGNADKVSPLINSESVFPGNLILNGTSEPLDSIEIYTSEMNGIDGYSIIGKAKANNAGVWTINILKGSGYNPQTDFYYVAIATDTANNTSEFSQPYLVPKSISNGCVVTNTESDGPGSLRFAIGCVNNDPLLDTIRFAIPGPGPYIISILDTLSNIGLPGDTVIIDGSSQMISGVGSGEQRIVIDGKSASINYPVIDIYNGTVKNLTFQNCYQGVALNNSGVSGSIFSNCDRPVFTQKNKFNTTTNAYIYDNQFEKFTVAIGLSGYGVSSPGKVYIRDNYIYDGQIALSGYLAAKYILMERNYVGLDKAGNSKPLSAQTLSLFGFNSMDILDNVLYHAKDMSLAGINKLTINGNLAGIDSSQQKGFASAIAISNIDSLFIDNNQFANSTDNSLNLFSNIKYCRLTNNQFEKDIKYGVYVNCTLQNLYAFNNIFSNNKIGGILFEQSTINKAVVLENQFLSNGNNGVNVIESENIKITKNIFVGNPKAIELNYNNSPNTPGNNSKDTVNISSHLISGSSLNLKGSGIDTDTVEVFYNDGTGQNAFKYAGSTSVTNGVWSFLLDENVDFKIINGGYFAVTATDTAGNTSELSGRYFVPLSLCNSSSLNTIGPKAEICKGDSLLVNAGSLPLLYKWSLNNQIKGTASSIFAKEEGDYIVRVTDSYNCTSSDTITIKLKPLPSLSSFLMSSDAGKGDAVEVIILSTPAVDSIKWQFSTNNYKKETQGYQLVFADTGLYTVKAISYQNGCSNSQNQTIHISPDSKSPKGAGSSFNFLIKSVKAGPVPAIDYLKVLAELNTEENIKLEVFGLYGNRIIDLTTSGKQLMHEVELNVSGLSSGIYTLKISAGKESRIIQFVKL